MSIKFALIFALAAFMLPHLSLAGLCQDHSD
jgi:hypothetical protein